MTFLACGSTIATSPNLPLIQQAFSHCQSTGKWKTAMPRLRTQAENVAPASLPSFRLEVPEAAPILRMSRAQLYNRIHDGSLKPQKDGARTYITRAELEKHHLTLPHRELREPSPYAAAWIYCGPAALSWPAWAT